MCYHQRIIYSCNHYGWCARVKPCKMQSAYETGNSMTLCHVMWSHPILCIRVSKECEPCQQRRGKFTRVKELLGALGERVQRLQKSPRQGDLGESQTRAMVPLLENEEMDEVERILNGNRG